jgi:protoheme IX farnesyltransferase
MNDRALPTLRIKDFFTLCKPKVVFVMLVTAWVGMYIASQGSVSWSTFILATVGIACEASAAAVINHLVDRHIDAKMIRTGSRPLVRGRISPQEAVAFAILLGVAGTTILYVYINFLTTILTLLTLIGYAFFYTLFLKRATPQNIVIGGIAGAMPPLLGWVAVRNAIDPFALLLVLIIFTWTPPHFWALAIYRVEDYRKANIPMLPVTHGIAFTKLSIVLYTLLLFAVTLLPYATGSCGIFYLIMAIFLGAAFFIQSLRLYWSPSRRMALNTFSFSIVYLLVLFTALLFDYSIGIHGKI